MKEIFPVAGQIHLELTATRPHGFSLVSVRLKNCVRGGISVTKVTTLSRILLVWDWKCWASKKHNIAV